MSKVEAPWTPEQVEALNRWQNSGVVHPFTCPHDHGVRDRVLKATESGWHCPTCSYTQSWAHYFMSTEPPTDDELRGTWFDL